ncbi:hypothetical protein [uncultured Helicobacter sp.]|uniref:hypothetical protein n=1 Tax=uncultured Helicobacter sp. TaxID=175537 RepID=UPI00260E61C7|nr:hypothetical protein [uncultured Helicobacter sp.]
MFQEKVIKSRNLRIWDFKKQAYLSRASGKFIDSIELDSQKYQVEEFLGLDSKGNAVYSYDFVVSDNDPSDKMVLFREYGINYAMDWGVKGIKNGEGRRYRIDLPYLLRHFHKVGNSHNPKDR